MKESRVSEGLSKIRSKTGMVGMVRCLKGTVPVIAVTGYKSRIDKERWNQDVY